MQCEALVLFTDCISAVCSPSQDVAKLSQLKEQMDTALTLMEGAFPLSLQVSYRSLGGSGSPTATCTMYM